MKKELTTDEYLQGLGLWTLMDQKKKDMEEVQRSIMKLLDLTEDNNRDETYVVTDNAWNDGTPMQVWSSIIKEQEIKVTGVDRKYV